jgi:hypothetical protein
MWHDELLPEEHPVAVAAFLHEEDGERLEVMLHARGSPASHVLALFAKPTNS